MTMRNQALADEIEAINSIYNEGTISIVDTSTDANATTAGKDTEETRTILTLPNLPYSFNVSFPWDYPDSPPSVAGVQSTGPSTKIGEGEIVAGLVRDGLVNVFVAGEVCLFDLVEEVVPRVRDSVGGDLRPDTDGSRDSGISTLGSHLNGIIMNEGAIATPITTSTPGADFESAHKQMQNLQIQHLTTGSIADDNGPLVESQMSSIYQQPLQPQQSPKWIVSDALVVSKSTFVARALAISGVEEAKTALEYLLSTNKKIAAATHNITAWRINVKPRAKRLHNDEQHGEGTSASGLTKYSPQTASQREPAEIVIQDCDDDGENAAGGRLLHLMQMTDVWNVMVVVSRWYGGVKLGPDRFKCINTVARAVLVKGGFTVDHKEDEGKGGGPKGKSKKR